MTRKEFQFLSTDITDWQYEDDGRWRHRDGLFEVHRLSFFADVLEFPNQELCDSYAEVYEIDGLDEDPVHVTLVTADSGRVVLPIPGRGLRVLSVDVHLAGIITPAPGHLRRRLEG